MAEKAAGRTQSPAASLQQPRALGGHDRAVTSGFDTGAQHGAGPAQRQQLMFGAGAIDFGCESPGSVEVARGGAGGGQK